MKSRNEEAQESRKCVPLVCTLYIVPELVRRTSKMLQCWERKYNIWEVMSVIIKATYYMLSP
jgi:hypothetical protein